VSGVSLHRYGISCSLNIIAAAAAATAAALLLLFAELLAALVACDDSWPFRAPVDPAEVSAPWHIFAIQLHNIQLHTTS
jgi:hypothetical protein